MEYISIFFMWNILVMLVYTATVDGQDCPLPRISDLGDTNTPSPLGLLPATLALLRGQGFPALQILQLNIVCLSQGSVRDTYGSTSLVVQYFDAQRSTTSTIQVDYQCGESGEWVNGQFASLLLFPRATLTTQLRMDCAICINPQSTQTYTPTAEEHCAVCSPCAGMMRCTGTSFFSQTCCNYFDMSGNCVESCLPNSTPNINFECECDSGVVCDVCDPDPCKNGGTCNEVSNRTFTCTCAPGYTGDICASNINDCDFTPCKNGGTCVDGLNTFTCACAPGYTGENCTTSVDPSVNQSTGPGEIAGLVVSVMAGIAGIGTLIFGVYVHHARQVDLVVEHEGDCVIGKENYHLTCSAKNVLPQDGIKFEWCKDVGGKLTPVRELHEDGISTKDTGQLTTLSFNPLKLSHDGKYSCRYTRRRRLICCLRMKAESSKQLSVDVAT